MITKPSEALKLIIPTLENHRELLKDNWNKSVFVCNEIENLWMDDIIGNNLCDRLLEHIKEILGGFSTYRMYYIKKYMKNFKEPYDEILSDEEANDLRLIWVKDMITHFESIGQ